MKFGVRKLSVSKMISSRLSFPRVIRHRLGLKMPRGLGWFSNPKKALYNRIYNRTSVGVIELLKKVFR